jgi:predicted component of type VI protein secretion system
MIKQQKNIVSNDIKSLLTTENTIANNDLYHCYQWFIIVATHAFLSLLHMLSQEGAPAGQVYDAIGDVSAEFKPRLTKPHPQLNFLRGAPVNICIEDLVNRGLYPQLVRARNMPNGVE